MWGIFSTFGIQIIGSITSLARRFPKFQIWVGKQMSNREYMYVANIVVQLLLVHYFDYVFLVYRCRLHERGEVSNMDSVMRDA